MFRILIKISFFISNKEGNIYESNANFMILNEVLRDMNGKSQF